MKDKSFSPIHPGEVLLEDFMKPPGLTQYRLAHDIGVTPIRIIKAAQQSPAVRDFQCAPRQTPQGIPLQGATRTQVVGRAGSDEESGLSVGTLFFS